MAAGPNFAGGTIVLDKNGQWFIVFVLKGGLIATLVQGSRDQVKTWAQHKYGNAIWAPGTQVNIDPFSSSGFLGGNTAIVVGPFSSKAEAVSQAASGSFGPGVTATGTGQSVPDATGLAGIAGALAAFFDALTDGKFWRSFGWLLLGIVLAALGIIMWLKSEIARSGGPPPVVPVPAV